MNSIINLNRFRKAKKRAEAQQRTAENRALFGRSKKDRRAAESERQSATRDFEGKRLD
jgi:Domain of unknown function (DUF4169)